MNGMVEERKGKKKKKQMVCDARVAVVARCGMRVESFPPSYAV